MGLQGAFDSPTKQILKASWVRLGVTEEIAEYLVEFDEGGRTVGRTPFALDTWDRWGMDGFGELGNEDRLPAYLEAERGTSQGDVSSPANWLAVMDILL